jgi:hypothetical protein
MKPISGHYPAYFENYTKHVDYPEVLTALHETQNQITPVFQSIPEEKAHYQYAEGKWTVNQLIIHISDSERIFTYRALRFARGDNQQPLPFEEDDYAAESRAEERTLKSCVDEFLLIRKNTLALYETFSQEVLTRIGNTAAGSINVNTLGFVIAGHAMHHLKVLQERYSI